MNGMKLTAVAHHRNGVGGEGFYAVAFSYRLDRRNHRMIATVFISDVDLPAGEVHPCTGRVAVIDADLAAAGQVGEKPLNQWRGDHFEPQLRQWIAQYEITRATALDVLAGRMKAEAAQAAA